MLIPTKHAYLKHDLYVIVLPDLSKTKSYTEEDVIKTVSSHSISYKKYAEKGKRFVYCETNCKDGAMGWYADVGNGYFSRGGGGFGKMDHDWAREHLTESEEYVEVKTDDFPGFL